jgi:hypothetical protein
MWLRGNRGGQARQARGDPATSGNKIVNDARPPPPASVETAAINRDRDSNVFTVTGKVLERKVLAANR